MRFLLILFGILLLVYAIRSITSKPSKPPAKSEAMVPCAHCQVHLPKSEALYSGNQYFCCKDHQAQWQKNNQG